MIRRVALAVTLVSISACADVATAPVGPVPSPRFSDDCCDPPVEWPVRIRSVHAGVIVPSGAVSTWTIKAKMYYDAYHASIGGSATVTSGNSSASFTFTPVEKHQFFGFIGNEFEQDFSVPAGGDCGGSVYADIAFRAWWNGFGNSGQLILDEVREGLRPSGSQQACTEDEDVHVPIGPGTSGAGDGMTNEEDSNGYTTCVIRYTYDLNTGEIINARILYCY